MDDAEMIEMVCRALAEHAHRTMGGDPANWHWPDGFSEEAQIVTRARVAVAIKTVAPMIRAAALWEAAAVASPQRRDPYDGCERLGFMDPETGARECSLDVRGGDCLCAVREEEAESIEAAIQGLVEKVQPHG